MEFADRLCGGLEFVLFDDLEFADYRLFCLMAWTLQIDLFHDFKFRR